MDTMVALVPTMVTHWTVPVNDFFAPASDTVPPCLTVEIENWLLGAVVVMPLPVTTASGLQALPVPSSSSSTMSSTINSVRRRTTPANALDGRSQARTGDLLLVRQAL